MSNEVAVAEENLPTIQKTSELSTFKIAGQLIGIPVLEVEDVLNPIPLTTIPLAKTEIAGLLNLRGRIVTAIDMRVKFGLSAFEDPENQMSIVVEKEEELYSLLVDEIGDVLNLPMKKFEQNPANLDPKWAEVANGVFRLDGQILVVLNVDKLLQYSIEKEEA